MKYDIIVVGGGPAGLTAGIYGARAGKRVLIFEREAIGGQISRSPLVENYPALPHVSGADFSAALFEQAESFGCEFAFEDVLRISGELGSFTVETDAASYSAATVVLAVGAASRKLGVAREQELTGKGVSYCAVCDGAFFRGKTVAVVGGGNSALEDALYLANIAEKVYLIHRRDSFRAEQAMIEKVKVQGRIELVLCSTVTELLGESALSGILVADSTGAQRNIPLDGLFIAIGHAPASGAFASLVKLDGGGYIEAAEDCQTSVSGIYTAGDCRTKTVRQLTTACGDGSVAALASCEHC